MLFLILFIKGKYKQNRYSVRNFSTQLSKIVNKKNKRTRGACYNIKKGIYISRKTKT